MDEKKLNMSMTILKIVLVAIGVFASAWVLFTGPDPEVATVAELDAYRDGVEMGLAINYTVVVLFIALIAVVAFFVYQLIFNTKKTVMSIIGIIIAFVVFLIFWAIGSSDTRETLKIGEDIEMNEGVISLVTAGLWTALIGVGAAILVWVMSPLMGRYRK